jgi:hypothetical protein
MTNEELAAIKARAEAATPGPWTAAEDPTDGGLWVMGKRPVRICDVESNTRSSDRLLEVGDVEFIAHARSDIPALLAEVERLRKVLADVLPLAKCAAGLTGHPSKSWDAYNAAKDALGMGTQSAVMTSSATKSPKDGP